MRTALISVYNKTGITEFARELISLDFKILASGGTAKHLKDAGVPVEDVANLAGGGAILGHRVVTLSREVHAGLLAKDNTEDRKELEKLKIPFIDMVCVDLYPLEDEINNPKATRESVIEKTDIGGPTMLRSGAKGGRIVICDPDDRKKVLEWLKNGEPDKEEFINKLRAKTEENVAMYVSLSAEYHVKNYYRNVFGKKILELAYGENAYQIPAFLYRIHGAKKDPLALVNWQLKEGSPLSYNNICDLDRMQQTMTHIGAGFEKNFAKENIGVPFVAIGAKHGNACGASFAENEIEAIDKMLVGDLRAIFGGSVMLNFAVDEKVADELIYKFSPEGVRRLLDIVAAPAFTPEAVEILARKKGKCRILVNPAIEKAGIDSLDKAERFRYVRGGFMIQPNYNFVPELHNKDVILAWAVGCTSNSNTITIVKDGRLYGNGVGQQDRVGAAKLAIFRADDANNGKADLNGAVAYSDSFFPFPDAPQVLIDRGIKTIFSTSGSVNDEKIVELCKSKGVDLIMLPDKEARGFYQH
jgi:phosphoribosylaminoimidazolecarboxamide formyltransferase/IMP cyclohydrolase